MTRASLLCVLLVGLCLAGQALGSNQRGRSQQSQEIERDFPEREHQQPQPFRAGHEYTFTYNGQIATGLQQDTATAGEEAQQKSATRIQAQAKIQFHSDRHATLSLEQIRLGHMNQRISEPQQVQPMGMFDPKQIEQSKREELQLALAFTYEDGVVARIQFHPEDSTWSKNIKRSVLNLIQLNLKRNNAQGLRSEEVGQQLQSNEQQQKNGEQGPQQLSFTKVFTIPEITIEGECQTTYTINKAQRQQRDSAEISGYDQEQQQGWAPQSVGCPNCFNVTKSINFKQCNKIADVAYGYQTQQQQSQCAQCQQQWARQQQQNQQQGQKQQEQPSPCDQCDPKEVKENKLERSTVQRFVLAGKPDKYAIKRAELISQYVYKNLRAESGEDSATMQAVVAAELVLRGVKQQSPRGGNQQVQQLEKIQGNPERDETLLFSNNWDTEEKRFYMFGDEEFQRNNPFAKVTNKVQQAQAIIRKLIEAASNKANGIEVQEVVQIQRLVELLRMCSEPELKEIQQALGVDSQQQKENGPEQQKIQQILGDALAMAGTRNTINVLVNQILNQQLSPAKAAQTLKSLSGLPAPSDSQVNIVLKLCKNEQAKRHPELKQSCWLTFGAMVGELCNHKTQKNAQQSAFGAQSGFNKDEICSAPKKDIYRATLVEQYEEARTTYEKVLALKALGNAGIDTSVQKLEEIIKDKNEQRIPRIQAIDALRRLRTQMPRKIQRVLLPIFMNTREHPAVRMAAFSMIMNTQPEQSVVDQVAYTLSKERSKQVQSFVYTTMKALAQSKVPCQQNLAKHLKSALKLSNIDESTLRGSRKYQVPIYSAEEKEGLFLTLTSVVSSRSSLPAHLAVSVDSLLNGEFEMNNMKIGMTQAGIEQWYEKLAQQFLRQARQYSQQQQPTRGQRSGEDREREQGRGSAELRNIFEKLGIKNRKSQGFTSIETSNNQQDQDRREQPFGMINVRIGDVDQAMFSLDRQSLPEIVRKMLDGEKPSLRRVSELLDQPKHFRLLIAQNLNEKTAKIATSLGVPLRMLSAVPILASIDGQIKADRSSDSLDSNGSPKIQLQVHATVAIAHIQRMETWMPAIATGVESVRCAEMNVPLQVEAQASRAKGLELTVKLPTSGKTQVLGVHTLPVTYVREYDQKTRMMKTPRVKLIRNQELEQQQRDVQKVVGQQTLGMPFHVKGHFHCPGTLDYKQLVRLAMATENQVHISYEPNQESPRAIRMTATGSCFERADKKYSGTAHASELKNFYSNTVKFQHAYPEDYEDMQLEDHSQRREKLNSYLDSYQPEQMYKHGLKLTAETVQGPKRKAEMEVSAACDSKFAYCKAFVNMERSAIYSGETQNWKLQSKIQILSPERVQSVQQLDNADKKHQKFVCQAEAQWGASERKQHINLRIQGEQGKKQQWRDAIMSRQGQRGSGEEEKRQAIRTYEKKTAFLNKFDLVAEYKLQAPAQSMFCNVFEAMKAANFWKTESQLVNFSERQSERSPSEGTVYATMVIDPITQKHCNVSVKTPSQQVRMQQIQLPTQLRPFPLVRQQAEKHTHSVQQLFQQLSSNSRAECKVDGRRVSTFDNVAYRAPVGKCYSVLAKDCSSSGQSQFSVLMKNLGQQQQDGQQKQSGQQQPKKIKVITPNQIIECEPKDSSSRQPIEQQPLKCKVNGKEIQRQQTAFDDETSVQYDDQEKTSVTIDVENSLQVRFNGAKATIKLSGAHKENQCGLCGHYDDQADEDEWRMANNERASGPAEFHRSFSIQDNQECSQDEQNQFYSQNSNKFRVESDEEFGQKWGMRKEDGQRQQRDYGYGSAYSDEDQYDDSNNDNDEQSWWGASKKQRSRQRQMNRRRNNNRQSSSSSKQSSREEQEQPIRKTMVVEMNHKICFSTQPVKQCPEGTHPVRSQNEEPISDYSSNEQQGSTGSAKKVPFACMDRSQPEARRLQRQVRQGLVVEKSDLPKPSFSEVVKQPTGCVRY